MKLLRAAYVAAFILVLLLEAGCGDYYRPVATPVLPPQPPPNFFHVAIVLSDNGTNNAGASTTIDVSGDSDISQAAVGLMPVHATIAFAGTRVYVANRLEDSVSEFAPSAPTPVITISLPAGSSPVFVHTTEILNLYVANSGNNSVSVISTTNNAVTNTVAVGTNPVALAETSDGKKLYVANQGNNSVPGSVSSINPIDDSVNPPIVPSSSAPWVSPVWALARSDSQRAYILDSGSGFVSAIDTSTDAVVGTASVGVGANYMVYDPKLNRLYVTNPTTGTLVSLDTTTDGLTATTVSVPNAISVAALPNGTRAYVSTAQVSSGNVVSDLAVVDAVSLTVKKNIRLTSVKATCSTQTSSELSVAAAADSSRVYVGNCDAGNIAIIRTSDDTLLLEMPAPLSSQKPSNGGVPPPQNPVFVVAGP